MAILLTRAIYRALMVREFKNEGWTEPYFESPRAWEAMQRNRLYTSKYTGNHTHMFLIDDKNILWYKIPKKDNTKWKPLFWEGYLTRKAKFIHCDGANLIVVDDLGKIHYRKIIIEKRLRGYTEYQWEDLIEKSNYWRPGWAFALFPFDHYSIKLRITLTDGRDSFCAMSHRGNWNNFFTTDFGKRYYEPSISGGCTTLYYYDGECIRLADPLMITGLSTTIPVPQKLDPKSSFIDCSASMLIYFGNDNSNWRFWWRIVDFDALGKVFYAKYKERCLTEWAELPLPNISKTARFKGSKVYNFGDNKRQFRIWFHDVKEDSIIKCKIYLPQGIWRIHSSNL